MMKFSDVTNSQQSSKKQFNPQIWGITSTIPIEVPLSANFKIIDINNLFISSDSPIRFIRLAESIGFPRACCAWIKGIYGFIRSSGLKKVIFVTGGDCSNTHALMEILTSELDEVKTFSYPYPRNLSLLEEEINRFCSVFSTTRSAAESMGEALTPIRNALSELDRMTWQDGLLDGSENFRWLVAGSDFEGDAIKFFERLKNFIQTVKKRSFKPPRGPRLGFLGVPPILTDIHDIIKERGGQVVYNEIPLQFAMIGPENNLTNRYGAYPYPYGVWERVKKISQEISQRNIRGLIHYTQSFCHRQIHDIILRSELGLPLLTLEGENPGTTDSRTCLRIESFLEILE